ncbi:hypothetical protein IEU95_14510 [Hoyosella rhizosphaerae]|uniref:Exo-alpha-sialidase n=1 Tax=Hoyosella rhizosphaerae TaxID=1755582 RepID=A0A916UHE5_9ACTN|nr:hypothetical protein [Hoyosella rhizosphaerae]MBN4928050.1 hypothetical protein [Hoyosella rhizosphaerae]GGC71985.1 hypothetical protein GCM10011410_26290 [Hoyosella rhizosphaerae]
MVISRRVRCGTAALMATTLILAACSTTEDDPVAEPEPEEPQPTQTLREFNTIPVGVPPELFRTEEFAGRGLNLLAGAEGLPYAVALNMAAPQRPSRPVVWVADDGNHWTPIDLTPDSPHSFSGGLVGNNQKSALVGSSFADGTLVSRVWLSDNRRDWVEAELPDEFARTFRVVTGTAAGERILVAGNAVSKDLGVAIIDGDRIEHTLLPQIPDREQRLIVDMAASGDNVVLIAQRGDEGSPGAFVAYTSDDGGITWDGSHPVGDSPNVFVAGVEASGEQFVMTGGVLAPDSDRGFVPAAWTSDDGVSWTPEFVPPPPEDSVFYIAEGVPALLGRPSVRDGHIYAVASNDDSLRAGFYHRVPEGEWFFNGTSELMGFPGAGGVTVGLNPDERLAVLSPFGTGKVVIGVHGRDDAWSERLDLGALEQVGQVEALTSVIDRMFVKTLRVRYDVDGADFSGVPERQLYELFDRGDANFELENIGFDPPEVGNLTNTVVASTDNNELLLLGSRFSTQRNRIEARGWFLPAPGQPWIPVDGFGAVADSQIKGIVQTDSGWYAVGTSTGPEGNDPASATVWRSDNGREWQVDEVLNSGNGSNATAVCQVTDGPVLVAGSVTESDGTAPAVWRLTEETWERATAEILTTGRGELTGCASSDDETILSATSGGRNLILRTTDGIQFEGTFRTEFGSTMREAVRVNGGFAAAGRITNDDASGPVVWLSDHGFRWEPWRVPARTDGIVRFVKPYGDGIVFTMDSELGDPVQIVESLDFSP